MLEFYQRLFINIVEEKEDDLFFRYAAKKDDPILYKFVRPNFALSDEALQTEVKQMFFGQVPFEKSLEDVIYKDYFLPFVVMIKNLRQEDFDKLVQYKPNPVQN